MIPMAAWNLLALNIGVSYAAHDCIHDTYIVPALREHEHFPFNVHQDEGDGHGRRLYESNATERSQLIRRRLAAGGSPLRIKVDYTYLENAKYQCTRPARSASNVDARSRKPYVSCSSADFVDDAMIQYIKKLTDAAVKWFGKALRVLHPTRGSLKLRKYCYQFAPPPDGDKSTKYNKRCARSRKSGCQFESEETDFVLTITANPTGGSTVAYAVTCQSDALTGRPISGLANFGPAQLRKKAGPNLEDVAGALPVAIHEIAHALGFSASKFDDFIDAQGRRLGKQNVVREFQASQIGHPVTKIITPKVVEMVKKQFGCYDWPHAGGELEDYGGSGTAGSHWEKRVFRDEFMTGTASQAPVLSAVSMALFEDSGWYKPDYSMAEHLHWGNNGGCPFASHTCKNWDDRFFCRKLGSKGCTHNRISKGYCNLAKYRSALPVQNRYFSERVRGGRDVHADYCPFMENYNNEDCTKHTNTKKNTPIFGEEYGTESRCFDATVIQSGYKVRSGSGPRQHCHRTSCKDGVLTIHIGDASSVKCPTRGGKVAAPSGFNGEVWCPPAGDVCTDEEREQIVQEFSRNVNEKQKNSFVQDVKSGGIGGAMMSRFTSAARGVLIGDEDDAVGADQLQSSSSTALRCKKAVKFEFETPAKLRLTSGGASCLWIDLKQTIVGMLELKGNAVTGTVYMQAVAEGHQQQQLDLDSGAHVADETTIEQWPSPDIHEVSMALDAGKPDQSLQIPKSMIENGEQLLITFVADADSDGSLELVITCHHSCMNGGQCVNGACACKDGWGGLRCAEKACPSDCSDHGECDLVAGACTCAVGWAGDNCAMKEHCATEKHNSCSYKKGSVAIDGWAFFPVTCEGPPAVKGEGDGNVGVPAVLTYRMTKPSGSRADPFLLAQIGQLKPSTTKYVTRDVAAWKSRGNEHIVSLSVRTGSDGGATIGISNSDEYAKEELQYTGTVTCELSNEGPRECPRTESGICNDRGDCKLNPDGSAKKCHCLASWTGPVCDVRAFSADASGGEIKGLRLMQHDALFVEVALPDVPLDQQMTLQINGQDAWMGISLNRGKTRPNKLSHRNSDYTNYGAKWNEGTQVSTVTVHQVHGSTYTLMICNPNIPDAKFDLQVKIEEAHASISPSKWLSADENDNIDIPAIPLAMVSEDGKLPEPVLKVSSRSSVEGMASSNEMRLLKVEEFCSQSKTGFYVKCSNIEGKVTICSDQPALVYHGLTNGLQPKDESDFVKRSKTKPGAPPKMWAHLPSWQDNCHHHVRIQVDKDNNFVGVAALQKGQYVTWNAVMQANDNHLFLNGEGSIRPVVGMAVTAMVSSLLTCFSLAACMFGYWFRRKNAITDGMKRIRQSVWGGADPPTMRSHRLQEAAVQETELACRDNRELRFSDADGDEQDDTKSKLQARMDRPRMGTFTMAVGDFVADTAKKTRQDPAELEKRNWW